MSNVNLKIKVPAIETRTWDSLTEIKDVFSEAEIVAMVHRYCDAQDHAKNYRVKRAEKVKLVMALAKEKGLI